VDKLKGYSRYLVLGLIVFIIMAVYVLRLADWQILNGSSFLDQAAKSNSTTVAIDAARGEILDVNGAGLAVNKTGYAIVFDRVYMTKDTQNKTILQLTKLLTQRGEKWTDVLPIKLNAKGTYEFITGEEKEAATLKSKYYLNMNPYASADECMAEMVKNYKVAGYSPADTRNIVAVRYNMTKTGFGISAPYTFAPDVSQATVAIISENSHLLPGATAKVTAVRQYPNGSLIPHVIGTIGAISQEEYDTLHKSKGYELNDRLGKSGIEQSFEDMLRGKTGEKLVETTTTGALASETVTKAPSSGDSVYLTIDSRIQAVLNASLAQNVKATQANGVKLSAQNYKGLSSGHGEDCVAGAAVALRVKDFSVLAASTYPSYDLTEYLTDTNYYTSLIKNKDKPLVDRAFNGIFTPGSVIKPYVALAALQENAITTSTRLEGNSKYTRFAPKIFGSIGNYGMITANYAIQKSSNSFFYEVGYRLGITNMNLYAKHFGLGVKTGIELSESAGILAGPAERSAAGNGGWFDADTIEAAVGQVENKFTPLQLATYTATIANNGNRMKSHLVSKVTDYSRKTVISQTAPQVVDNIGVSPSYISYVQQAMRSVATGGTASSMFKNYGIAIAAKTGTAVQTPHSDNVVFVGYAPFDNPEIAVAVVLEHGATSLYANTVAKDIFDAYFFGKTADASGNLVMPSASSTVSGNASGSSTPASGPSSSGASSTVSH